MHYELLILGEFPEKILSRYSDGYKGVQRQTIEIPFEFYNSGHEINGLYAEYEKLTEIAPYLHDLSVA